MKNFTLFLFALLFSGFASSQIVNNSFEDWQTDTTHFMGLAPFLPNPDTTSTYLDPVGWTSTNSISAIAALGGRSFVTRSSNATYGSFAVQLITDSLAPVAMKSLTLPGFILNGSYQLNIGALVGGANITPLSIKGAGQPINQRLADFKGYYSYTPILNPNTHGNDTCLMWATLRKGDELIADAIFKSTVSTSGYQPFSVPFNYVSCDMPDTLVILLSSSIPNIPNLILGQSNLVRGSVLLVDTLSYDTLTSAFIFTPFAFNDTASTTKNIPVNIHVKGNDEDCGKSVSGLTLAVTTQPIGGITVVDPNNNFITYTPVNEFLGSDTFYYTLSDNGNTSTPAQVVVQVNVGAGITETSQLPVLVFPVPAADELNVRFENPGATVARVYDITGRLSGVYQLNNNNNILPLNNLSNGWYSLQIINDKNQVLAITRFTVNR